MPTPTLPTPATELLAECAVCLSSFSRRLEQAGYPFTPPPNVRRLIEQIDAHIEALQTPIVKNGRAGNLTSPAK